MIDIAALGAFLLANGKNLILAGEVIVAIVCARLGQLRACIGAGVAALITILLGW